MDEELNLNLPIHEIDNRLLVLVRHIYFKRDDGTGLSVIRNMRYIAAQIITIAYIKDGTLTTFSSEKKPAAAPAEEEPGVWLEMN